MKHILRTRRSLILGLACLIASACSLDVPFDAPRSVTYSTDLPVNRAKAAEIEAATGQRLGQTSFVELIDGNDGLGARLRMIESAKYSIDLQYFLIKPDLAGGIIASALGEAANRGVRVRFLIDDAFTTATDDQVALLDSHPNIEIRLFNPMARGAGTVGSFIFDFSRVNRRMHNKSITIDRVASIIGGRNIADEYFDIGINHAFADFDIFLAGEVVSEVGNAFDLFWNDPMAVPVSALTEDPDSSDLVDIRNDIDMRVREAAQKTYRGAVDSQYFTDLRQGRIRAGNANANIVTDTPEKLRVPVRGGPRILAESLMRRIMAAEEEVVLFTPYFVPEDWGRKRFIELAERGVRVRVITNSLASTNHAYVHAGYYRHRKPLLRAGVELYEVRVDAPAHLSDSADSVEPALTMHSKLAIIDRQQVFVGSLNFDPRSIKINSEMGVFIEGGPLARDIMRRVDENIGQFTYRVGLNEKDRLIWQYDGKGEDEVRLSEPDAGIWRRIVVAITALLPVEGQL